jgi:hypothetical protein
MRQYFKEMDDLGRPLSPRNIKRLCISESQSDLSAAPHAAAPDDPLSNSERADESRRGRDQEIPFRKGSQYRMK